MPIPASLATLVGVLTARQPYRWIVRSSIVLTLLWVIGAGLSLAIIEHRLVSAAGHTVAQAAESAAQKIDALLEERYGDLAILSHSPTLLDRNASAITALLLETQSAYTVYASLMMADQHGRVIAATDPAWIGRSVSHTRWFQAALAQDGVVLQDAGKAPEANDNMAVSLASAVRSRDGRVRGVVAGWLDFLLLEGLLRRTVAGLQHQWGVDAQVEYVLLSESGELLADSLLRQEGKVNLQALGVPSALAVGELESGFQVESHGRRHLEVVTGYAQTNGGVHVPNLHWGAMVRVDLETVRAPITALLWRLGLGGLAVAAPMIALLLWSAKRLERFGAQETARAATSEEALKHHIELLHALVEGARSLTEAQDLEDMCQRLMSILRRDTEAEVALVGMFNESGTQLTQLFSQGGHRDLALVLERSSLGAFFLQRLQYANQPVRLGNLSDHVAGLGIGSVLPEVSAFLGVPIRTHGRLFGVLCLINKISSNGTGETFSDLDEQVVTTLTTHAGIAAENLQALAQAKQQANHDSLTGLLNHSAILDGLEMELERSQRTDEPLSVLIADLDHFKAVNDTYGHGAGDQVLMETANCIRQVVRPYDLMGRVGGEEFLLVLPQCGLSAAAQLADRLRRTIEDHPFDRPAGSFHVTTSIGVTTWLSPTPMSPSRLVELADEALYRAKRGGRNRIEVANTRMDSFPDTLAG